MARTDGLTFAEMRKFLAIGWGEKGARTADAWLEFNRAYFAGRLHPVPLILTPTMPFGNRIGTTCYGGNGVAVITLASPAKHERLMADRGVLLHEMMHQHLVECGEPSKHNSEAWCREVMRLHQAVTGERIWAHPEQVAKESAAEPGGKRRSVRRQKPDPDTGKASLDRAAIASWPHSVGIDLGAL